MARFGCIADDFTGASDMASFLARGGMRTILYNGIPETRDLEDGADAVVIALKTRTQDTQAAVECSLAALKYLRERGCERFYLKYCSTFDSTPRGNIGPVCDAVMEALGVRYTLLCPALPVNGRTVREGKLYVNGVLLQESSMKHHPLTPMWDCVLKKLMEPQSKYPVYELGRDLWETEHPEEHYYLVPDCENQADLAAIARRFGQLPLLTGGSGLAEDLAREWMAGAGAGTAQQLETTAGNALLLAGSCSQATRAQIARFRSDGGVCLRLSPDELMDPAWDFEAFWAQLRRKLEAHCVLVYTSDTPEQVKQAQQRWGDISGQLEEALASLAQRARDGGISKFIVAGGETSGAVTRRLGMQSYYIGESVAPGVPVMMPLQDRELRLVLKSGNFGQPDFFTRALQMLSA